VDSPDVRNQVRELHQVRHSEQRSPLPEHVLGIRCDDVGPLRQDRANALGVDLQQKALAVPVVPFSDANELTSAERMKRMRHANKMRG
jgi:hypothetical protein